MQCSIFKRSIVLTAVLVILAACGGGGDSLGNALPWCPLADDYVKAVDELKGAITKDARVSELEEAADTYDRTYNNLNDIDPDGTSRAAVSDLLDEGDDLVRYVADNSDEDDGFQSRQDSFDDSRELVERLCG